jgi:hypothetical protein
MGTLPFAHRQVSMMGTRGFAHPPLVLLSLPTDQRLMLAAVGFDLKT